MEQLQWRFVRHALLTTVLLVLASSLVFAFQTEAVVRGVVTDSESGQPLVGVTIILTGTTVGTTTNSDGFYSLRIVPGYNVIQYSFVGFKTQRENIDNRTEINVQLQSDVLKLDEVLVTGYGTTPRRQVTSSVAQISRNNIGDFAPVTVDQLLQGRATGVQFTSTSGLIGAPTNVRIRGAASISASTAPLYVIDGVPVTNPTTAGSSSIGLLAGGQGINPLLNINPNDIESIEVLKDAAASAIYGSRGSNGVILISTRQGRPDQQVINIRTYAGSVEPTNNYEMMNGEDFTRIWNDAAVNRFGAGGGGLLLPTTNIVNTDWTDLVSQTGTLTETSASVTGGTQRTRYFLSGTYRSEEGFVQRSQIKRYSGRARIDHAVSDQVRIGINLSPSRTDNNRIYTSNAVAAPFTYAALYFPNVPARNPDGSANLTVTPNPFGQFSGTPISNVEGVDFTSSLTQLLSTATVEYNILRGLVFNTELSVDLFQLAENFKRGSETTDGFPDGNAFASNNQYVNYNLNSTLQYTDQFEGHKYSVLGGFSMQRSENTFFSASGRGFPSDLLKTLDAAATPTATPGNGTSFAFLGYLARANYSYLDRYLLTLTGRIDGSSRFGADNRYGLFPSASAGWIMSDEDWFKSNVPVIEYFKIRASYGLTGNAEIGNFSALGLVGFGFNYNDVPGAAITQLENPDLRWEKTTQYEGALDFGILDSRVRGSVGYYVKNTTDLLLDVPVSRVNGFSTFTQNIGEMENTGLEAELTADILYDSDFKLTVSANISTVSNKVTKLVGGQDLIFGRNIVREGEPLGAFYLVRYNGPDAANGNATWLDVDGNVTSAYSLANRVIAGSPFPDYFGGFTTSFAYGPFDANIFFQFSKGNMIYWADGGFTDSNLNSVFNQAKRINDYWSPTNTDAANPQPRLLLANGSQASSRYLQDGSYLRLKQATVGYTLPATLFGNIRARIYAQGTNLFTETNFQGMDPEAATTGNIQSADVFFQLPQARTIIFGLDLTL